MRCIWLDGSTRKACRVLVRRLAPLGYRIVCRSNLPDPVIAELAEKLGCAVATSDRRAASRYGWVYVEPRRVRRKNAKELATFILKMVGLAGGLGIGCAPS